jgi:hypothetical protein
LISIPPQDEFVEFKREADYFYKQFLLKIRALTMEAAHTSEMSVDSYFTRQYIPEDKSELHGFLDLPYRFSE